MSDSSPLSTPIHDSSSSSDDEGQIRYGDQFPSEPEGEDLNATLQRDYIADPRLDTYENAGLDDETELPLMTAQQRMEAEDIIRKRLESTRGFAAYGWGDEDERAFRYRINQMERRREDPSLLDWSHLFEEDSVQQPMVLQDISGSLTAHMQRDDVRREVAKRFQDFIVSFKNDSGDHVYIEQLQTIGQKNLSSLFVEYTHLSKYNQVLALWLGDAPSLMLGVFDDAATALISNERFFPKFLEIVPQLHVRIQGLPIIDPIRDLRMFHLNALIRTHGVVTKRTTVIPELAMITWICQKCGRRSPPLPCDKEKPTAPSFCSVCGERGGFKIDTSLTIYRNYQKMTIQEPLNEVPPGRLPRSKEIILHDDLANIAQPGHLVDVTGIYEHEVEVRKTGFPVFSTVINANCIKADSQSSASLAITDEDVEAILALSHNENLDSLFFSSIAPSIYGHDEIKAVIAMSLLGGSHYESSGSHHRGDIHVLLMGDPGTAKSQFLKYAELIAPRAVFTSGKGASAVGLTAAVHRDPVSGEWTLEGGALVLADGGVCLIDEFEKMSSVDRDSIHETMEQQTISIAKAGINTSLQARCSIIAACNPISGRYDQTLTFTQNSGLSDPIVSRFDVLCVVRDVVDPINDEQMSDFILRQRRGMSVEEGHISQDLLKKYIAYAKEHCEPKISNADKGKLVDVYATVRHESVLRGGTPITVRSVESIVRLSEAHAKLHLRENVIQEDIDFAISVSFRSFIDTRKYSDKKPLEKALAKYIIKIGDSDSLLSHVLQQMVKTRVDFITIKHNRELPREIVIKRSEFEAEARAKNITMTPEFFSSAAFRRSFERVGDNIIYRLSKR